MREKRFRRWRINDWDAGRDRGLQNERGKKRDGGKRGGRMAARARARARHVCVSNSPALQLSVAGTESRESWRLAVLFWASLRACGGPGGGGEPWQWGRRWQENPNPARPSTAGPELLQRAPRNSLSTKTSGASTLSPHCTLRTSDTWSSRRRLPKSRRHRFAAADQLAVALLDSATNSNSGSAS